MDNNSKFSILERYGENYTEKEYITDPAIGRDEQIKQLLLLLLTPEKSAILVGKPGVGKTAIVEGIAYRIQKEDVPNALLGYNIINIKTASLLGTMPNGESKVQVMIDELKEKDKIILFVDEIHMLIGATDESALDFANIFKEGLGRGSIKVVGATTTEEYERYILRDKAFTRRFQKIDVPEPTRDETIKIVMGTLPKIEKTTGVRLKYSRYQQELIMTFIVDLTGEYKRVFESGSRYPDISLTIVKSAFSYTVFDNRKEVNIYDFEKAISSTHLVYPDVIKKELPVFKETFKDMYNEENGILKDGIVLSGYSKNINTSVSADIDNNNLVNNEIDNNIDSLNQRPISRREEYKFGSPTTLNEMGTRDIRVEPEKQDNSEFDTSLMDGIVLNPEEDVNSNVAIEGKPVDDAIINQTKEEFEGVYYTPTSAQVDGMYEAPVRIGTMGRDERIAPPREDNKVLDGILTNDREKMQSNTNFDLELEDIDEVDNEDDDFYE